MRLWLLGAQGNSSGAFPWLFEQCAACQLKFLGGLHIGVFTGQGLQGCTGHAVAQEAFCFGQAGQFVQWCHGVLWAVHTTPLNALNEAQLCPGVAILDKINAGLR